MALQLVTPAPSPGLITSQQAIAQLRGQGLLEDDEDLAEIEDMILEASRLVQDYAQRRYQPETWNWVLEQWHNAMVLPLAPATDSLQVCINSITYGALDGTTQTLDPSIYWVRPAGLGDKDRQALVRDLAVPRATRPSAVVINFTRAQRRKPPASGPSPAVPAAAQRAAKLLVSHYYQNRDAVVGVDGRDSSTELPLGVVNHLFSEMWHQPGRP